MGKNPPISAGGIKERVQSLGPKYPLEKEMATHSVNLTWTIPGAEEPDGLQSVQWQSCAQLSTYMHTRTIAPTPTPSAL